MPEQGGRHLESVQEGGDLGAGRSDVSKFLSLLTSNYHRIYGYILSQVPVRSDADDLMQESLMVMWRKFGGFRAGTDFAAWGIAVARNEVLRYRRQRGRAMSYFSEQVLELIEARVEGFVGTLDERMDALKACIGKLPVQERKLLRARYAQEMPVKTIAEKLGKSDKTIYRLLGRIRTVLGRCVRTTLARA